MIRGLLVSLFSGIILTLGWSIFIDAQLNTLDKFQWVHVIAPICSTISAVAMNLVSITQVKESIEVKLWLFFWFTCSCFTIGMAIWILAREYAPPINPYPGVGILVQTVFAMSAGFLFFIGRKQIHSYGNF